MEVSFSTKKDTLAQVFSCEFCEISKNNFFYRTTLVAASIYPLKTGFLKFSGDTEIKQWHEMGKLLPISSYSQKNEIQNS